MCTIYKCLVSLKSEEGIRSPGTGVKGGCEPSCGCQESNLGPLQGQTVLLIAEPSLQLPPHSPCQV